MPTVTIGATTFSVYMTTADADAYFVGRIGSSATWAAITTDDKARAIVSASRLLDLQAWTGTRTSSSQANAWPRTGVAGRDGITVSDSVTPQDVLDACAELALALYQDPTLQDRAVNPSANVKVASAAAGTSVEFFGPQVAAGAVSRFPAQVWERIAAYLDGSGDVAARAFGVADWSSATCCSTCGLTECLCPQLWPGAYDLI